MRIDLPLIWAVIISFGVMVYVVLDGFDLGVGLLFGLFPRDRERDLMMATIAPVWDGNETWLVLGGATLYAAFPLAYGTLLTAAYFPIIVMLTGLIFRGVAFEFRYKAGESRRFWDAAFIWGSAAATFCQGLILGTLLQGIQIADGHFAGGPFDWLSPFSVFCGFGLLVTYAALGSGWLILKLPGELQRRMYGVMRALILALGAAIAVVSLWTALSQPAVAARWFAWDNLPYFMPVPILVMAAIVAILTSLHHRLQREPFFLTLFVVFLGFTGLIISIFPHIVPPTLDIWAASSPAVSQRFTLMGLVIVLPLVLAYSAFAYWVFRGKVREGQFGHD
jgi:cytochrome bd ubiquinol oxidase subunit II